MSELLLFFGPNCGGVLRWVLPRGRRGARRARVDQVPSGQRRLRGWSSPAALWACELLLLPGAEPSELPVLAVASLCETVRGILTLTCTHRLLFLLEISGLGQLLFLWQPFQAALLVILEFNICCSEGKKWGWVGPLYLVF